MKTVAWKIRGSMLFLVVGAGFLAWCAASSTGSERSTISVVTLVGWSVLALLAVALGFYLERTLIGRLLTVGETVRSIYTDGDLTRRAPSDGGDEISGLAADFNRLMESFEVIVGKVLFNSLEFGLASQQLTADAKRVASASARQQEIALTTAREMNDLTANLTEVNRNTGETTAIAEAANGLSTEGMAIVRDASAKMEQIAASVTESAAVVCSLGERSKTISGIVQKIREIADQTNLLALNAAIEAARAGEQGRGFAVVADEVRKLAERTSQATGEIGRMIAAIQSETESAISAIEAGSGQAKQGADLAQQAAQALERINSGARETMEKVGAIAIALGEQSATGRSIAEHVGEIKNMADDNRAVVAEALVAADQVDCLAANLKEVGTVFKLGHTGERAIATHRKMPAIVAQASAAIGRIFEQAVEAGQIRIDDLFDEQYQPISNTKPQKFKTRFDDFTDRCVPAVQEDLMRRYDWLVYAICTDRNAYVPTHNQRFSKPLTGDEKHDFMNNRTKRKFEDPVGRQCGRHERAFLLQTYRRDTGEVMHDISAPIYVKGRHWGGFRIGYRTEV
jgi:methyl-accepting chemotaxis protein